MVLDKWRITDELTEMGKRSVESGMLDQTFCLSHHIQGQPKHNDIVGMVSTSLWHKFGSLTIQKKMSPTHSLLCYLYSEASAVSAVFGPTAIVRHFLSEKYYF